jgi:hypothetical protein
LQLPDAYAMLDRAFKMEIPAKSSADEIRFREKANAAALSALQAEQTRILEQLHGRTRMAMDQQRRLNILLAEVRCDS